MTYLWAWSVSFYYALTIFNRLEQLLIWFLRNITYAFLPFQPPALRRTTTYHPQSDGLVERANRTLISMLAICAKEHPSDWETHLRKVCLGYNTSTHPTTGCTPFYLTFCRLARFLVDVMFGSGHCMWSHLHKRVCTETPTDPLGSLPPGLSTHWDAVNTAKGTIRQKSTRRTLKVGDLVWLHSLAVPRGHARKLYRLWTGPADATYLIQDTLSRRRWTVVRFNRLKPCNPGTESVNNRDWLLNHSVPADHTSPWADSY